MKKLILVGMMTDCGVVTLVLLRFFDSNEYSPVEAASHIEAFGNKSHWLFVQENAHRCTTTMTYRMLKHLERSQSVVVNGTSLNIGGYDPSGMLPACYLIMRARVILSCHVLRAEFPSWELLHSMRILDLRNLPNANDTQLALKRLAGTSKLPLANLQDEYKIALHVAKTLLSQTASVASATVHHVMHAWERSRLGKTDLRFATVLVR